MRSLNIILAGLICAIGAGPSFASGIVWVDRPDARDTYLPHAKDLVLEETASLTVQIRTNRHPDNTFAVGEKVRAIVAVSEDAMVYLIGIDEKWDVAQIFPGRQFTDNRLTKGVEHAIPPERGVRVGYYVPDLPGRQYLLAVASPVALDLRLHLARLKAKPGDLDGAVAAFKRGLDEASPGCAVGTCAMTIKESSKVVAVVVGCGAYAKSPLGSTVPDAKAFGKFLQETYGPKLTMRLLCDPPRAEIQDALANWLPSQVGRGDAIFVYYSGHGTSVKDLDGDESDGADEALVPTDYAPVASGDWGEARRRLILDDDLHAWVKSAADKGAVKTVLVFDACHSGTAQRGLASPAAPAGKMVPKVFRGLFATQSASDDLAGVAGRGLSEPEKGAAADVKSEPGWGVIAACKDTEISWAGDPLSLMTTYLIEGLTPRGGRPPCDANGDGTATIQEAAAYARQRVTEFVSENRDRLARSTAGGDPTQTVTTLITGESLGLNR